MESPSITALAGLMTPTVQASAAVEFHTCHTVTRCKAGFFVPAPRPGRILAKGGASYMIHRIAWLAAAGALGTLARYGLAGWVHRINGTSFPWGTVAVNLTGCFLAGLLWALFENRWPVSGETRTLLLIGFVGAFTTFSTFVLETGEMFRSAEWMYAAANVAAQNGVGIVALFAGAALGRIV